MTPILDRIRAHGGDVIRDQWRIRVRRGRLPEAAIAWLRQPRIQTALLLEVWPEADAFEERAAIREYCGGQDRATAERAAYEEVMVC
ncbi:MULTISPECIES: hypothetical protein [Paracoccaceae]|uniref:hypothetical protein n=1 Tax=Paracoccaceae TaxID=31989 RepID=UPI0020215679|nr:hypothetical protein [Phaeovulum sp. NW3]MCL7465559.1 hypothetical protein [Phaeovulum sp. NW3]